MLLRILERFYYDSSRILLGLYEETRTSYDFLGHRKTS